MKKNKSNFLEWNIGILAAAFRKIDLGILLIIALDSLFYVLSGYLVMFWFQRIQSKAALFALPQTAASLQVIDKLAADVRNFYYFIIFSFVLVLLLIIFLASIAKGLIWAKTTGAKISLGLISKFLALNLIWMGLWFALIFIVSIVVEPGSIFFFMIAAGILDIYFTNTVYTIFMKTGKISSMLKGMKLSITKIHLFVAPYALVLAVLYALLAANSYLQSAYSKIAMAAVFLAYAAAVRYYTSTLVLEVSALK